MVGVIGMPTVIQLGLAVTQGTISRACQAKMEAMLQQPVPVVTTVTIMKMIMI